MNSLPNETLINILTYLPQKHAVTISSRVCKRWNLVIFHSSFYSTIHINSKDQLKKVIQLAKVNKVVTMDDDKPISHYVNHLIFHFKYRPKEDLVTGLLAFPNLQSIDGLIFKYGVDQNYGESIYHQLNHPTNYCYWHFHDQSITKFNEIKDNLKSLNIEVTKEMLNFNTEHHNLKPNDLIHMEKIGMTTIIPYRVSIRILHLPKEPLTNLTKLEIDFYRIKNFGVDDKYIIDEQTFESIHYSCPSLESLSLTDFYMIISDKYQQHQTNKNKIIPANHLKNIKIRGANLKHPLCFHYISAKHPYLESLDFCLNLVFDKIPSEEKIPFQKAIFNMILQLPLLKKLIYQTSSRTLPEPIDGNGDTTEIWPHLRFITWLYQNPNQLIELEYPFEFILSTLQEINIMNYNNNENENNNIASLQQPFGFLNHLTSLSLSLDHAIHLALTYLSQYKNTLTVSSTIESLTIQRSNTDQCKCTFMNDWLDIFPNLFTLNLIHHNQILVSEYGADEIINNTKKNMDGDEIDNVYIEYLVNLHQLIKERKQQQQQDDIIKRENKSLFYKLKNLEILSGNIYTKDGFEGLLKKCHLKKLKLDQIIFICPFYGIDETYLDLSNIHLELFYFNDIRYTTEIDVFYGKYTKKLIIHETLSDSIRNVQVPHYGSADVCLSLHIKCKYMDQLIIIDK
ncbi:unnamed protein product [Cunninghamella blakesleeana]